MIEHIEIKNFTVFENLNIDFVPGVNLFIGANGTGKTHLLKLLYAFQSAGIKRDVFKDFSHKLIRVFLPGWFIESPGSKKERAIRQGIYINNTKRREIGLGDYG